MKIRLDKLLILFIAIICTILNCATALPLNSNDNNQVTGIGRVPTEFGIAKSPTAGLTDTKLNEYNSFLSELYAHDKDKDVFVQRLKSTSDQGWRSRRGAANNGQDTSVFPEENSSNSFASTKDRSEQLSGNKQKEYTSFLSELYSHDKDKNQELRELQKIHTRVRRQNYLGENLTPEFFPTKPPIQNLQGEKLQEYAGFLKELYAHDKDKTQAVSAVQSSARRYKREDIFSIKNNPNSFPPTASPLEGLPNNKLKEYAGFITELYAHDKDKSGEIKELQSISARGKRATETMVLRAKRSEEIFTKLEAPEQFPASRSPLEGLSEDKLRQYDSFIEEIHGREPGFEGRESKALSTPAAEPEQFSDPFAPGKKNPIEGLSPEKIKEFDDFAEEIHGREPGFMRHTELTRKVYTASDSKDGATVFRPPTEGLSEDKLKEYDSFIEEIHGKEPDFKRRQPSKREIDDAGEERVIDDAGEERVIAFRPVFVYRQQHVKKDLVKVTPTPAAVTAPPSRPSGPVFVGTNHVIFQQYNPHYPYYQYGAKYPYVFPPK